MKIKFTLFLLFANILVFSLICYNISDTNSTEEFPGSIFSSGIKKISISGSDNKKVLSVEMKNREWWISIPYKWRANPFAITRMKNELCFLETNSGFLKDEKTPLSNYGLEPALLSVDIEDDTGVHSIKIGKKTLDERNIYVLSPDQKKIISAPISLLHALLQTPEELSTKTIFSLRPYEINSLSLRTAFLGGTEQRIGLVRAKRNFQTKGKPAEQIWQFETPIATDANTIEVEKNLKALTSLTYEKFIPTPSNTLLEQAGLINPEYRFALEGQNASQDLLVGKEDLDDKTQKTLFAKFRDNPVIFTVNKSTIEAWKHAVRNFRDPLFFRFEPELVSTITIYEKNQSLLFHKTDFGKQNTLNIKNVENSHEIIISEIISNPLEETNAQNILGESWQMPVAPGSLVQKAIAVEPKKIIDLFNSLNFLQAKRFSTADDSNLTPEQRRASEAFVGDNASQETLKAMLFDKPLRIVEIQYKNKDNKIETKTLTIAPAIDNKTPIHAKVGNSIYSISSEILDELTTNPMFFRIQNVFALPGGAKINAFRIIDISEIPEKIIYNEQNQNSDNNWIETLNKDTKPIKTAYANFLKTLKNISAKSFLSKPFSLDFSFSHLGSKFPEKWRYRIEFDISFIGNANEQEQRETITFYTTKRLGGTTQIAGFPKENLVFFMQQELIDTIHVLTFAEDASKDIPNLKRPEPTSQLEKVTITNINNDK